MWVCGATGLPPFIGVNVSRKALEATDGSGRKTVIQTVTVVKEQQRLLLQGGENGRGWSLVIGQKTGDMNGCDRLGPGRHLLRRTRRTGALKSHQTQHIPEVTGKARLRDGYGHGR